MVPIAAAAINAGRSLLANPTVRQVAKETTMNLAQGAGQHLAERGVDALSQRKSGPEQNQNEHLFNPKPYTF